MIHRRELLRTGLGTAGALLLARTVRADGPADDSDPATLIAKMGPMMSKIPIEAVNIADGLDLIKGAGWQHRGTARARRVTRRRFAGSRAGKEVFETVPAWAASRFRL